VIPLRRVLVCAAAAAALCLLPPPVSRLPSASLLASARGEPLPDPATLAREVRARLRPDRDLLSQYTYIERREEIQVSKLGEVTEGPVKVYEVYPSLEPGHTWKRLVAVDGKPLSAAELAKADRKHRDDVRRAREKRARESPSERRKRLQKEAEARAEREAVIDEIFDAYDVKLLGRDTVHGEPTIVAALEPRPSHRPRSEEGELMKKLRVRAWISERDYELARVEAEAIADITVGWGIIGRLHKGARGVYERRKVNDEVWLPAREEIRATGRALMLRTFDVHTVTEWSRYKKDTQATE
jgi:hypothetical protein